ncbi:DUF3052 family protein [Streptomyces sp. NBC_00354]|uniref:DUF3052 family protein n=1 Tax=Streptomyces sp. NBC_00354 TaxID=2975723 RepID=UPI003FA7CB69
MWLLTPKTGQEGSLEPSDVAEASVTAGLATTTTIGVAPQVVRPRDSSPPRPLAATGSSAPHALDAPQAREPHPTHQNTAPLSRPGSGRVPARCSRGLRHHPAELSTAQPPSRNRPAMAVALVHGSQQCSIPRTGCHHLNRTLPVLMNNDSAHERPPPDELNNRCRKS